MNANRPPILQLDRVSKRYGPVTALCDVSLTLHAGEVLGLIGDNGAGKSTLAGVISGTHRPDTGTVRVDGRECHFRNPAEARKVGIETVFQNLALIPTLSIADNVYLGRELYRGGPAGRPLHLLDKRGMRTAAAAGFARLGVTLPPLTTKAAALSGGQRQSVSIGRAVMWGSHIVVMDEPTAALGVEQTELVLSLIERLKSHDVGVILISHNMDHVLRVADRVAVMRRGRKVADVPLDGRVDGTHLVGLITGAIEESRR
ncbi:monosaccharide ABC transporter ATP-binding protein (CUT2 family) [Pseudonocardia hierapolitana]|uniref:Monosaccharide ABC transporter ATP-binding protein (CUT2 family) n=1 Tax=Pseudonocardia hierapolitana TaxID=1128676 RepID=A0A561SJF6_9PSEU|nr:ATP-binding cassette domain-containing protein [Pseudonocardia hierapolitana]TWF75011.1 monosaccharide ABC transporter ATP-binding protein (CUT2 family) [Pseudonocardia hierapolitana]